MELTGVVAVKNDEEVVAVDDDNSLVAVAVVVLSSPVAIDCIRLSMVVSAVCKAFIASLSRRAISKVAPLLLSSATRNMADIAVIVTMAVAQTHFYFPVRNVIVYPLQLARLSLIVQCSAFV